MAMSTNRISRICEYLYPADGLTVRDESADAFVNQSADLSAVVALSQNQIAVRFHLRPDN